MKQSASMYDTRYTIPYTRDTPRVAFPHPRRFIRTSRTRRDGRRFFHAQCHHVCDEGRRLDDARISAISGVACVVFLRRTFHSSPDANATGAGGIWHARGAFGSRAPRLRAPVRATAGGTQASRLGARTRDISVEEGHPPRRRISGFWRGFVAGNPPSPRSLRGASVPAAARARFGTRAGL